MTTAVDTNVLIDVLSNDSVFAVRSRDSLAEASGRGRLIVCDVVIAELGRFVTDVDDLSEFLRELSLDYVPTSLAAAAKAGRLWSDYRRAGGSRRRAVADFLIAAHAMSEADRLLTRDTDFQQLSLGDLEVLIPEA